MGRRIEFSDRQRTFSSAEVRASGRFTADEVRDVLARSGFQDLRQLGCPENIFHQILEQRAQKLGIAPASDKRDRVDDVSDPDSPLYDTEDPDFDPDWVKRTTRKLSESIAASKP